MGFFFPYNKGGGGIHIKRPISPNRKNQITKYLAVNDPINVSS